MIPKMKMFCREICRQLYLSFLFLVCFTSLSFASSDSIILDDFESGGVENWWVSQSGEYYKGGTDRTGLSIVEEAGRGKVLKVHLTFPVKAANVKSTDARSKSQRYFVARNVEVSKMLMAYTRVTFDYKITTRELHAERALVFRIRTSKSSSWGNQGFSDPMPIGAKQLSVGEWVHVEIPVRPSSLRNCYNLLQAKLGQICFRLESRNKTPAEVDLYVDNITLHPKETVPANYRPRTDVHVGEDKSKQKQWRILLAKHSAAGYYGIEKAVEELEGTTLNRILFVGRHQRLEGYPQTHDEMAKYSTVVIVDVDPFVMTLDEKGLLADFVASGGGLLWMGGPNSFGNSVIFDPLFEAMLPVGGAADAKLQTGKSEPRITAKHFITQGIPSLLGILVQRHSLTAKKGAQVLINAGPSAPSHWGWYHGGRPDEAVLFASTDAHSGAYSAGLMHKNFYIDPKTGKPAWTSIALLNGDSDGYHGPAYSAKPKADYKVSLWLKGDLPYATVSVLGFTNDSAQPKHRQTIPTSIGKVKLTNEWRQYEGTFKTNSKTRRIALIVRMMGNPQNVTPGQVILIDDASITEAATGNEVMRNGDAEDVSERPLLAVGSYGRGRVAVLNAFPPGSTGSNGFFGADFYDELIEQTLLWLCRREPKARFLSFAPSLMGDGPFARTSALQETKLGDTITCDAKVAGEIKAVRFNVSLGSEIVHSELLEPDGDGDVKFTYQLPSDATQRGDYTVRAEILGLMAKIISRRDYVITVHAPIELTCRITNPIPALEPEKRLRLSFQVSRSDSRIAWPRSMKVRTELVDPWGESVVRCRTKSEVTNKPSFAEVPVIIDGNEPREIEQTVVLPQLEPGDYRIISRLVDADSRIVSQAKTDLLIIAPRREGELYPVMAIYDVKGGGQLGDDDIAVERARDLLNHGMNTLTVGNIRGVLEILRRGGWLFKDYTNYTDVRPGKPTEPCVFSPQYGVHVQERVSKLVARVKDIPRYLSEKVIDEPYANAGNMDYCEYCQAEFKKMFGAKLMKCEEVESAVERRRFNEFVAHYVATAYKKAHEAKTEAGGEYDLILTYWPGGYASSAWRMIQDILHWCRYSDRLDFDDYVYFYPKSEKLRFVVCNHQFDFFRNLSDYLSTPWGFYVETDDRNHPYQQNPIEASSECAWSAVAHGADYLNTFFTRIWGTGNVPRWARWEHFARTLNEIHKVSPLLSTMEREKAPIAHLFAYTDQFMSEAKGYRPGFAYELLGRAAGQIDVLHEVIAAERGIGDYQAIFLAQTKWLRRDVAAKLSDFVTHGGLLITDSIPSRDENDQPLNWPAGFFEGETRGLVEELKAKVATIGKGKTVLFNCNIDEFCKQQVTKNPGMPAANATTLALRKFLFDLGLQPIAMADVLDVEVGPLACKNTKLLVVVNHGRTSVDTKITLSKSPFEQAWAGDAAAGRELPLQREPDGSLSFKLKVNRLNGRLIALYPERPGALKLEAGTPAIRGKSISYSIIVCNATGARVRGRQIINVTVTDSTGRKCWWYGGGRVTNDGLLRVDMPLSTNAPVGTWKVEASDLFGLHVDPVEFNVRAKEKK